MIEDLDGMAARLLAADPDQTTAEDGPVLDPDGFLIGRAVELERLKSAADAEQMLIYSTLARRADTWQDTHDPNRSEVGPEDLVAAELAPALHLAPITASIRLSRAIAVTTRLPAVHAAYRRGDLDQGRVLAILEATTPLSTDDANKVEDLVLPGATGQTAGELRAALRKAVITVDPTAAEKRRKAAVKGRSVTRYQDQDGMSVLRAVLSAVDTNEMYDLIDEVARRSKTSDDPRSMDARRADAMFMMITGRDPHLGPEDDDDTPPGPPPGPGTGQGPGPSAPPPPPAEPTTEPDDSAEAEPGAEADESAAAEPTPKADDDLGDLVPPGEPIPNEPADWFKPPADERPVDADEPVDVEDVPADPAQGLVNPAWRDAQLNRFERISEHAALMLSAMTTRRPSRLPWVAINTTTGPDGESVVVGELQGYGPITADYARHLLRTGGAIAAPGPSGREPTTEQTHRHDPPEWLAQDIKARDGTCRFPGCRQSAHRGDLDHTTPFPKGLTVRTNLGALCRRHHRIKGSGAWTVAQDANGVYAWTSKITGRTYVTYPRGTTGDWRGTDHPL